jgi:PAS domain S-box-containing protein
MKQDRKDKILKLFEEYLELYAARDERLIARFSENFSGFAGSSERLIQSRDEWIEITRQDFAQVPGHIRLQVLDLALQELAEDLVVTTGFFHIHLPGGNERLSRKVARLVLIFHLEGSEWMIAHSSISIPYHSVQEGEVYPFKRLQDQNASLQELVNERTRELHKSQKFFRLLTEDAEDVHWQMDQNFIITYISPADERQRGFPAAEVVGRPVFEILSEDARSFARELLERTADEGPKVTAIVFRKFEVQQQCKDGSLIWGEVLAKADRNEQGEIVGYHGITRNITERKRLEQQVRELAFHDTLTGLANRRLLLEHLDQAMSANKRSRQHGALLFLDLDNFKPLNDAHGHAMGDLLLIEVAARLKDCCSDQRARHSARGRHRARHGRSRESPRAPG